VVRLGFIVEGHTEKIIIESPRFADWLNKQGLALVRPVIDAEGGGNLLPQKISPMVKTLNNVKVEHIIILTDLERDPEISVVKQRIANEYTDLIFIAVKAIEAWFLADSKAMAQWLSCHDFYEENPEQTVDMPWDRLRDIANTYQQQGTGKSKPAFAKRMVKHYGFDIEQAANHVNCPSAKFFCNGLIKLTGNSI